MQGGDGGLGVEWTNLEWDKERRTVIMRLSIVYLTGRIEPRLDWLVEGICQQARPDDRFDLVAVDALHGRRELVDHRVIDVLDRYSNTSIDIRCSKPKPNIWQGEHRVVSQDWWAASNGRNTGLALAREDFVCGVDDRCKPGPAWLDAVRHGYTYRESVIAGSYDKFDGPLDARVKLEDHRRLASPHGAVNCGGGWLYGCTFCLPLEWALEVNGFEEGCDSLTGEDYIFGLMLHNAGYRIDFNPKLYVMLDRDPGDASMKERYICTDKGVSPNDKSHAALSRFGSRKRTEFTPDLRELRVLLAGGGNFPSPDPNGEYRDWFDGQNIREMGQDQVP